VPIPDAQITRYVKAADGLHIAYQIGGEGIVNLLYMPTTGAHIETEWEGPALARFLRRLTSFSRLIRFNMRGTGLSDPVSVSSWPDLDTHAQDLVVVLDAVGCEKLALIGNQSSGPFALNFAIRHPERTAALVLAGTWPRMSWAPDYPWGLTPDLQARFLQEIEEEGWQRGPGLLGILAPSAVDDPAFVAWWDRLQRHASPAAAVADARLQFETDLTPMLTSIRVPVLVLCREGDGLGLPSSNYLAEHIPGAKFVTVPGEDNLIFVGDQESCIDEIQEFLTGQRGQGGEDRQHMTVVMTDIVRSTDRLAALGDRRWRDLLDQHDKIVRKALARFGGREVNTRGDGFSAAFINPVDAILSALTIASSVRDLDIEIRAGVHIGECEIRGSDLAGLAVHIAARIGDLAGPNEVLVSSELVDLAIGSNLEFTTRGDYVLKGVPGDWELFAVRMPRS
jgi:class 3 adenylate cyclase/pimeloyl-ACP methyl ester carboxylesterase